MGVAGLGLALLGYALFYTGASNLFTGGKGWGFLQSLLNQGQANASGAFPNAGKETSGGYLLGSVPFGGGAVEGQGISK